MSKLTIQEFLKKSGKILQDARAHEEKITAKYKLLHRQKMKIEQEMGKLNSSWWHLKMTTINRLNALEKEFGESWTTVNELLNDLNSEESRSHPLSEKECRKLICKSATNDDEPITEEFLNQHGKKAKLKGVNYNDGRRILIYKFEFESGKTIDFQFYEKDSNTFETEIASNGTQNEFIERLEYFFGKLKKRDE